MGVPLRANSQNGKCLCLSWRQMMMWVKVLQKEIPVLFTLGKFCPMGYVLMTKIDTTTSPAQCAPNFAGQETKCSQNLMRNFTLVTSRTEA